VLMGIRHRDQIRAHCPTKIYIFRPLISSLPSQSSIKHHLLTFICASLQGFIQIPNNVSRVYSPSTCAIIAVSIFSHLRWSSFLQSPVNEHGACGVSSCTCGDSCVSAFRIDPHALTPFAAAASASLENASAERLIRRVWVCDPSLRLYV
jgi:hypothetical protein